MIYRMTWTDLLNTGGVVVLITTAGNLIAKHIERRTRYKDAVLKVSDLYDVFNRIIDDSSANRILIMKGSNGGSRPTIGSNLYVSVLHEASTKGIDQIKPLYQNIHIDDSYIKLLQKIIEKREIAIPVSDFPPGSFLRLTYDKEGLKHAYFFEVKGTGNNYYFGSFSTTNPEGFTDNDRLTFRLSIDRIKKIFEHEK